MSEWLGSARWAISTKLWVMWTQELFDHSCFEETPPAQIDQIIRCATAKGCEKRCKYNWLVLSNVEWGCFAQKIEGPQDQTAKYAELHYSSFTHLYLLIGALLTPQHVFGIVEVTSETNLGNSQLCPWLVLWVKMFQTHHPKPHQKWWVVLKKKPSMGIDVINALRCGLKTNLQLYPILWHHIHTCMIYIYIYI